MNATRFVLFVSMALVSLGLAAPAKAQQGAMSFFVTSVGSGSWNSSHLSRGPGGGCSQDDLKSTGGNGLFFCFAVK